MLFRDTLKRRPRAGTSLLRNDYMTLWNDSNDPVSAVLCLGMTALSHQHQALISKLKPGLLQHL